MARRVHSSHEDGKTFAGSFASFYNNSELSDVTVKSGEYEFLAHQVVLSAHSPVFRRMFTGGWKESQERILSIDEPPSVVEAMIYYMYHFSYNGEGQYVSKRSSPLVFESEMYAIGEMYEVEELKGFAKNNFSRILSRPDGSDMFPGGPASAAKWDLQDFTDAVRMVYSSTVEGDRGLRDMVTAKACDEAEALIAHPDFAELVRGPQTGFVGDFALALARKLVEQRNRISQIEASTGLNFSSPGPPIGNLAGFMYAHGLGHRRNPN